MGQPSPALVAAVNEQATARGIDPAMLLAVIGYETGGTYDTEIWGGRNNNYFGLIQFGPSERATYGVREGMTPAAQVTAALNFLEDRGFRPGMTLLEMYSTINAGNPHPRNFDKSDGNGTVRGHAARIEREYLPAAQRATGSVAAVTQQGSRGQNSGSRGDPSVFQLQSQLSKAGFDPGPLDGIMGPRTEAAIAQAKSMGYNPEGLGRVSLIGRPLGPEGLRGSMYERAANMKAAGGTYEREAAPPPPAVAPPLAASKPYTLGVSPPGKPGSIGAALLRGPLAPLGERVDNSRLGQFLNAPSSGGTPTTTWGDWTWSRGAPPPNSPYAGADPREYGLANNVIMGSPQSSIGQMLSTFLDRDAQTKAPAPTSPPPPPPTPPLPIPNPPMSAGDIRLSPEARPSIRPPSAPPPVPASEAIRSIYEGLNSKTFAPQAAVAAPTEQAPSPLASWLTSLVSGVRPAMETVGRGIATANNAVANFAAPSAASIGNAIAAIFGGVPSSAPTPGGYVAPFNPFER